MKKLFLSLAAVCMALGTMCIHAQTTTTYAVNPAVCSPGSTSAISCAVVYITPSDDDPNGFSIRDTNIYPSSHYINFLGPNSLYGTSELGTAQINQDGTYQPTYGNASYSLNGRTASGYLETSLSLTFQGTDASGNPYTGEMVLVFHWTYSWTCSGRGCGGTLGWHRQIAGGSLKITR